MKREAVSLLARALKQSGWRGTGKQGRSACSAFLIVAAPCVKDTARLKGDDAGKKIRMSSATLRWIRKVCRTPLW